MFNVSKAIFKQCRKAHARVSNQRGFAKVILLGLLALMLTFGVGFATYKIMSRTLHKPSVADKKAPMKSTVRKTKVPVGKTVQKVPESALKPVMQSASLPMAPPQPPEPAPAAVPAPVVNTREFDKEEAAKIQRLGKIYSSMDAEQVAAVLTNLSDDEASRILETMSERQTAKIFSLMEPKRVALLSRRMGLGEIQE